MLKFVKKFTIIFAVLFTVTIAKAEPGVIEFVFRTSGVCSHKTEQISIKGNTNDLIALTIVNENGKIVSSKQIPFKSTTVHFDVPCGFYNLIVTDIKTGSVKNRSILLR